jgi:hypothetical protein
MQTLAITAIRVKSDATGLGSAMPVMITAVVMMLMTAVPMQTTLPLLLLWSLSFRYS